jgi:hypothetical protein
MASYLSFNSLMQESLLTVYYNGEVLFFLEMNQSETRIACGGHVC